MNDIIDLLSIQTPLHLRNGIEHQTRFDFGDFELNIFETFQPSTKVKITHKGLSISSMIRGFKNVYTSTGKEFKFASGILLILTEDETIFADFPQASTQKPVQCATILISGDSLKKQLDVFNIAYPNGSPWEIDFSNFNFNNNSGLVRAFNELLQVSMQDSPNYPLRDLMFKSLILRIIQSQKQEIYLTGNLLITNQLSVIKNYIKNNLEQDLTIDVLMQVGNCSKSNLYRLFENYCGKPPGAYILQKRMENAENLLLQQDSNISDVAFKNGFNSLSYFVQKFKAYYKCTPGEYVKKFGKKI